MLFSTDKKGMVSLTKGAMSASVMARPVSTALVS